jgi:hypothetical protein
MSGQNTRPQKKTKINKIYIMEEKGRQRTSLEKQDHEAAKKKADQDQTGQLR